MNGAIRDTAVKAINFAINDKVAFYLCGLFYRVGVPLHTAASSRHLLGGKRSLILAPHPDDDILGCGGTILATNSVAEWHCVYITDGSLSHHPTLGPRQLGEMRKSEAEEVCKQAGVRPLFLDHPNEAVKIEDSHCLTQLLVELRPDIVYLPFFMDFHVDHRVTNTLFLEASKTARIQPIVISYQVQSCIPKEFVNLGFDISDFFEEKRRLLTLYRSQSMYFGNVLKMNRCLAASAGRSGACEVFWQADFRRFEAVVDAWAKVVGLGDVKYHRPINNRISLVYDVFRDWKARRKVLKALADWI